MNIRLAENTDKEGWDDFVSAHKDATAYHLFAWRAAVEKAYGHQGHYLMAEENGQVVGLLPLFFMRFPLLYRKVVSLPFCDVGGALAVREDVAQRLYDEALAITERLGAGSLEVRCRAELPALQRTGLHSTTRTDKVSMLLKLPGSSEALWEGFKSKLRSQVRKAEKNNLTFSWGDKNDRGDFYAVFSKNMRELGSPVHSRGWIDAVLDGFGHQARLGLVYHETKPVGAGIILCQGRKVSIPWASTLREYNQFSPNMLLYWNFLQFAADTGCNQFDFGRSTIGEGTYKFKAQWGTEPHTLYWHTVYLRPGAKVTPTEATETNNRKRELAANLWSRLPLWLANILGPVLRRHISL